MQREKIAMIQLVGWISLIQLLTPVISDTTLYVASGIPYNASTTDGLTEDANKPATETSMNFTTDKPDDNRRDTFNGKDTEWEYMHKSEGKPVDMNLRSEYIRKLDDTFSGLDIESAYREKSDYSTLKTTTFPEYTQKSEATSFEMDNTGSEYAQKEERHLSTTNKERTENTQPSFVADDTKSEDIQIKVQPSFETDDTGSEDIQIKVKSSFKTDDIGSDDMQMKTGYSLETDDTASDDIQIKTGYSLKSGETESDVETKEVHSFGVDNTGSESVQKFEDLSTENKEVSPIVPTMKISPEQTDGGEMSITYQSTTANLKESTNKLSQVDFLTFPYSAYSSKIAYFDEKSDIGKKDNNDMSLSGSVTVAENSPSKALFDEKSSRVTFSEALTTPMSVIVYTPYTRIKSTTSPNSFGSIGKVNKFSMKTSTSHIKSPSQSMISISSARNTTHIRNSRTAFENLQANSDDNQTQITPTTTEFSTTETAKHDENSFVLNNIEKNLGVTQVTKNVSDNQNEDSKEDMGTTHTMDGILDSLTEDATEINNNATRSPKKIQEGDEFEERYPEGRIRPIHPDPGYGNYPEKDIVRPYRPDVPLHKYPYYRPTPDYRTPIVKDDKDYTRSSRPDSEYPRVSFRPNYLYSKTSQDDLSPMPVSVFATSPKPYKPSFNRPSYHPQSSFGRPYRPDYHRPSSKPTDDYSEIKGGSTQEADVSEHSRADNDYTRLSEMLSTYTKIYNSDSRPSATSSDLTKSYGPTYDGDLSMHSKATSPDDLMSAIREMAKVSKPDMNTNRPSNYYPRPGFGNNYQASDSSVKPFSVGTVTSAKNITRVEFIKADCFDNHMKVTMRFNGTFNGLVYSSGYASDSSCSYVNGSGRNHYEFYIRLNRCGTLGQQEVAEQRMRSLARRRQERAQYLVNTVTVQYNPVIEEDIDEHFRVTCEYGYDFWKTVTFPVMSVESPAVRVRTGSPVVFTLPPPQCNMEIRNGFGPSGTRVSGPVNVGDPLTLVIHMKSESTGFDILVKNCYAHNGAQKRLQLIDANGCVVQEKLVSAFRGVHSPDRSQQITLYSYLKAFRFTGSPALYIECDVHMCHGSCPPQRCYWRHMYKRSANEVTTEPSTTAENIVSESISLFQALEVRHEEVDSPYLLSLKTPNGYDVDDVVCLRTGGFGAILACLLLLLMISSFAAVCMCLRLRKMKKLVEAPESRRFVEFDGHVPIK